MALSQTQTAPPIHSYGFSLKTHCYSPMVLSFHAPPPSLPVPISSIKTHDQSSLFSNHNTSPSLSTVKRKLLCRPANGKHVREDYLVKKISAQEVQELVKGERNVPLIVDFFATWCGPCILMAHELEMNIHGCPNDHNEYMILHVFLDVKIIKRSVPLFVSSEGLCTIIGFANFALYFLVPFPYSRAVA